MQNSEQIKPVSDCRVLAETDPEADELLKEYHRVIEEARRSPDAEARIERIRGTVKILAGYQVVTPQAEADEPEDEEIDDDEEDDESWEAVSERRRKFADFLITQIFAGDISDSQAQALLYVIECSVSDNPESETLLYQLRENLFFRADFGDKLIREFTYKISERFKQKAA